MLSILYQKWPLPIVQIFLLGLVSLCCPGMFNALNGLGAGGLGAENINTTNAANSVLYACFAVVGVFAGSITNTFGVRSALSLGSLGYAVYASALWVFDTKGIGGYVVAAGAILGCCAAVFWSAQGAIMMSYPEEKNKGKYVATFWCLFNIGGILGSVITLAVNLKSHASAISTVSYSILVAIMIVGSCLTSILAPPSLVVRPDGSRVTVARAAHWKEELNGIVNVWKEWRILYLFPAFLASNWFYAYQFHVNALYFNAATRALNGTMYWGMQIIGSLAMGFILDFPGVSRRARGLIGMAINFTIIMSVWAGGFAFQLTFENDYSDPIAWTSPRFGGPFVLYMLYGLSDSCFQTYMYWLMGAMSNDPALLARYAGFYKALQSAGAAASFGIDAGAVRLRWSCLICWIIVFISFPGIFMVTNKIEPTTAMELSDPKEDIKDSLSDKDTASDYRTPGFCYEEEESHRHGAGL